MIRMLIAAALATHGGSALPESPTIVLALDNGRMTATWGPFQAVADRIEVNADAGMLTLVGRADNPAALYFVDGQTDAREELAKQKEIKLGYAPARPRLTPPDKRQDGERGYTIAGPEGCLNP
jgi:hypothetical protein